MNDEKHQFAFKVNNIYRLVIKVRYFRKTDQNTCNSSLEGQWKTDLRKQHCNFGSSHNLSLDKIKAKYPNSSYSTKKQLL